MKVIYTNFVNNQAKREPKAKAATHAPRHSITYLVSISL